MLRFLLAVLFALLAAPVAAQDQAKPSIEGSWALEVDGTPMFRFDLASAGEGWSGSWWRPKSFASDGNSFSRVSGPAVEVAAGEGRLVDGWIELSFPDARPGAVPDVFRFRLIGPDRAEMVYVDTKLAPFTLVRVAPGAELGPWDAQHVYRRVSIQSLGLPPDPQALAPVGEQPAAEPAEQPPAPAREPADSYKLPPGAKPIEGR